MKTKKKLLIEVLSLVIGIIAIFGVGKLTGIVEDFKSIGNWILDLETIIRLAIMVLLVIAVEKLVLLILNLFTGKSRRFTTIIVILQSVAKYTAAVVIICWGLSIIGVNVSTIAASVGLVALIIGFGAESLIEDVITGLFMMFENQYNVNDIVEVDGFRGTVTSIGIRTTSIMDPGGNVKIINNSEMKNILNRSNISSKVISEIQIAYSTDLEELEKTLPEMMNRIYELHMDTMKGVPEYLGVSELGSSGITLKFAVEVDEKDLYHTQRLLNRELVVLFKKANVEIPYMQVDVHQI